MRISSHPPSSQASLTFLLTLSVRSPLGRRATDTSGLSSGGGGCATQLYSRFSIATPHRSYSADCCLQESRNLTTILHKVPIQPDSPQPFVAIQTDHCVVAVLQQQSVTFPVRHEGILPDGQRPHPLPVGRDPAQVAAVVVEVVLPAARGHRVLSVVSREGGTDDFDYFEYV